VVERHPLELQLRAVAQEAVLPAGAVEVAERDELAADLLVDAGDGVRAVEVAAVVAVAVDGEQHLRLDLREAVDHAARAEVGRAARPHGADRGGREEGGDRLRDVRHVGRDAVAALHPERAQPGGDPRHLLAQLAPGDLALVAQLARVHDRHAVVGLAAEGVLGVVELRAAEPHGARHRAVGEHLVVAARDAEVVPDRGPEGLELLDRPAVQLLIGLEAALERAHVLRHQRVLDELRRRVPQLLPHGPASCQPCCGR
jgi:hypothetical protein